MEFIAYPGSPAARRSRLVVVDAPSNLGLRPPRPGTVPGVSKLAGALRDQGLVRRLGAADGGVVTAPRYEGRWRPGAGVRNEAAIRRYSVRLADRIGTIVESDRFPLVLGGDCSILLGTMLALRRRGRFGLAFVDGHTDFRYPDNAPFVGAAAGEDLALATGRGGDLADLEGRRPLVADHDVVALGVRDHDEALGEVLTAGIRVLTSNRVRDAGPARAVAEAVAVFAGRRIEGFWVHCDVDVLDASVMPAVDTPEPDGLRFGELRELLGGLLSSELAVGLDVTIFDPDLDEDGRLAAALADCLCDAVDGSSVATGRRTPASSAPPEG